MHINQWLNDCYLLFYAIFSVMIYTKMALKEDLSTDFSTAALPIIQWPSDLG